jgi:hypothetical protein
MMSRDSVRGRIVTRAEQLAARAAAADDPRQATRLRLEAEAEAESAARRAAAELTAIVPLVEGQALERVGAAAGAAFGAVLARVSAGRRAALLELLVERGGEARPR